MQKELKTVESELRKEEKEVERLRFSVQALAVIVCVVLALGVGLFAYFKVSSGRVSIEKSEVSAPEIGLASQTGGTLEAMYVDKGDVVVSGQILARVGNELVKAKMDGVVTAAEAVIGKLYSRGETVVSMIDPTDLRVVGHLDENKGLDRIRVGDYAVFTVDAFGSKEYRGIVDEISPTSREGDVVFSISDKRETKVFDVKVRFNTSDYPELKNGMSARLWIYVK